MKDYLEYNGYRGTANFNAADKVFYGKLEAIGDLVSFEANNMIDLEFSFKDAVIDYQQTCKELGKAPEEQSVTSIGCLNKYE